MQIQNNLPSMNASRNQSISERKIRKSLEKLSSGFRIVRAGDDAAGLAISELMRSRINGLNQAMRNVNDGIGLTNVGDGALTEVHAMLQRMKTLATEAANGTYSQEARAISIWSERNCWRRSTGSQKELPMGEFPCSPGKSRVSQSRLRCRRETRQMIFLFRLERQRQRLWMWSVIIWGARSWS